MFITDFIVIVIIYYIFLLLSFSYSSPSTAAYSFIAFFMLFSNPLWNIDAVVSWSSSSLKFANSESDLASKQSLVPHLRYKTI